MNDPEPTRDTDELRAAMRRAAAGVEVPPTPSMPSLPTRPSTTRRFAPLLVAAAVVLIAGLGAWAILGDDGSRRVESGPARPDDTDGPHVTIDPTVLEQTGVWRLPEGLDDVTLVAAQSTGFSTGFEGSAPGRLAVDDPDDPQRWMMVQAYNEFGVAPRASRPFTVSDEVEGFTVSSGMGSMIWFQIEPTSVDAVVSGTVSGIDEQQLTDALTEIFAAPGNSMPGEGFDSSIEQLTEQLGLTDSEIYDWDGDANTTHGGEGSRPSIELTLMDDASVPNPGDGLGGPEVTVSIAGTDGAPTWAQMLRYELMGDASLVAGADAGLTDIPTYSMHRRPDLGPQVIETRAALSGVRTPPILTVFTDDGVMLSANLATTATTIGSEGLTEAEQLRIINSLVAMDEQAFLDRLDADGIEFIRAANSPGG